MRVKDKDNTKTSPSGSKGPLDSLLPLQPFMVTYDASDDRGEDEVNYEKEDFSRRNCYERP